MRNVDGTLHNLSLRGKVKSFLIAPLHTARKQQQLPAVVSYSSTEIYEWEVDRHYFRIGKELGYFGAVYSASWEPDGQTVAVKSLHDGEMVLADLLAEVAVMKDMHHDNIVQLLGVCIRDTPYYIVTEYMSNGNLLECVKYLRKSDRNELSTDILIYMSTQVAAGVAYLHSLNCIHRDLAARNILVGENYLVKVADFGLARFMKNGSYKAGRSEKFPVKWTAPEGLSNGYFSAKSDVWSFGILLWEVFSYGDEPYSGIPTEHVLGFLEGGNRMLAPRGFFFPVKSLMELCLEWEPARRPKMTDVHASLGGFSANDE